MKKSGYQVAPEHYNESYDTKGRFISYWHQIREIIKLDPESVLEIGIGNGFVSEYLKKFGYFVTTIDIDPRLHPNFVGSIKYLPIENGSYDVVACFETLEHIPFDEVLMSLKEIRRVASKRVLISIPDCGRAYQIYIQIPIFGTFKKIVHIPRLHKTEHVFNGEHYWELSKSGYSLQTFSKLLETAGFSIIDTYRIFEHPYHRFFILGI